jgi:16S rRNA (uracil1498-N3)-methyltransferase
VSNRFYFDGPLGPGDVSLEGPEAHHLASVRRFVVGDRVTLFSGDGFEYPADVMEIGKKRVLLHVVAVERPARELASSLHVACAMPKGDRGDFLIEKLTELGVTEFTPLMTERAIVKIDRDKTEKLRRAVIEASKQCGRNVLMRVNPPAQWLDWCALQSGARYLAHPIAGAGELAVDAEGVTVAIGAEGGFSPNEVNTAIKAGWAPLALGSRILRVETAAIAVASWFALRAN